MSETESYVCRQCGVAHEGLPTDWGYKRPDAIYALSYMEEYLRARSNNDFCALDESRYFVRGVLYLPFQEQEDCFGWGIWAEVSREDHDIYVRHFHEDASALPRFSGRIANSMPGYPETTGLAIDVQLGLPDKRPTFLVSGDTEHILLSEQKKGLSAARHHELLEACGHFDKPNA